MTQLIAGVAAVSKDVPQPRVKFTDRSQHRHGAIAILYACNVHDQSDEMLDRLVTDNVAAGRLAFTGSLDEGLDGAEVVFIAVGTPSRRGDGHADLTYVYQAAEQIARRLKGYAVIVTKSTVPVGTGRRVAEIIRETRPELDFDVASNPEFLCEGNAIGDFMWPNRVVIGVENERAEEVLRPLFLIETPMGRNIFRAVAPIRLTGLMRAHCRI